MIFRGILGTKRARKIAHLEFQKFVQRATDMQFEYLPFVAPSIVTRKFSNARGRRVSEGDIVIYSAHLVLFVYSIQAGYNELHT
jgi:hypothetical protein